MEQSIIKKHDMILPDQTVFIDSKAEKENRSATIQMSQTSMWVRQRRSGAQVNEKGCLKYPNMGIKVTSERHA